MRIFSTTDLSLRNWRFHATNQEIIIDFDTVIYPSVKLSRLSMKNVGFKNRHRLKVSL